MNARDALIEVEAILDIVRGSNAGIDALIHTVMPSSPARTIIDKYGGDELEKSYRRFAWYLQRLSRGVE